MDSETIMDKIDGFNQGSTTVLNLRVGAKVKRITEPIESYSELIDQAVESLMRAGTMIHGARITLCTDPIAVLLVLDPNVGIIQ